MKCEHAETQYLDEPWPTGEAIEFCTTCGASRAHWEQGESDWIPYDRAWIDVGPDAPSRVDQIKRQLERQRLELERLMGDGHEMRIAAYMATRNLRELGERLDAAERKPEGDAARALRDAVQAFGDEVERKRIRLAHQAEKRKGEDD